MLELRMVPARGKNSHGRRRLRVGLMAAAVLIAVQSGPAAVAQGPAISLIRDTEIEEIVRKDSDPIFRAAGLEPANIKIHLVGDKELNAFVAAGQQMFLNTGLIAKSKTPSELQGVIAHETGHIAGGHLARQGEGMKSAFATYMLTMGLGLLAAAAGQGDAASALLYSSNYFATLNALGYTRTQESSADQAAAGFLDKAGISGKGLVEFFDNLRYQEVFSDDRRFPYFRSHPLSSQRIEALRNVVTTKATYTKPDSPQALADHALMVAKVKSFMNFPQQTFQDYPETDVSFPARYARAIATYKDLQADKAIRLTDELIAEQPNNAYLYELKGQILYEHGKVAESEAPHRKAVELKPNAPLLRLNLAQALLAQENNIPKADEAIVHITRSLQNEDESPMAWRLLAIAFDRKSEPGMARLASAEQNFFLGQAYPARDFAERAMELLPKDTPQWRRANDIVQVVNNAERDSRDNRRGGGFRLQAH